MDLRLILDPPARGSWNMAVDEALFQAAQQSRQTTVRLYQWSEPTLSLGYFQGWRERGTHPASAPYALVRRSTGGGAILHDRELTYSVIMPIEDDLARSGNLVRQVHESLIATLRELGVTAQFAPPSGADDRSHSEPFLCFQRCASLDVFVAGAKVAGSAQRKLLKTLLQHGSVLLRQSAAAPELLGIEDLAGVPLPADTLAETWIPRLLAAVVGNVRQRVPPAQALSDRERELAEQIESQKFASNQWNLKR